MPTLGLSSGDNRHVLLHLPDPALVLLVGPSGAGKSTFAEAHFDPSEIVSSDRLREMLSGDAGDQGASAEAFRIVTLLVNGRLARRLTTVVDATNLRAASRRQYLNSARRYAVPALAIAFRLPDEMYLARNATRADRTVASDVIANQAQRMADVLAALPGEGYETVHLVGAAELATGIVVIRRPT